MADAAKRCAARVAAYTRALIAPGECGDEGHARVVCSSADGSSTGRSSWQRLKTNLSPFLVPLPSSLAAQSERAHNNVRNLVP